MTALRLIEQRRARVGQERICHDDDGLDHDITLEEVKQAAISLKTGKASGVDGIIVEWFKLGGENMQRALWLIMKKPGERNQPPRTGVTESSVPYAYGRTEINGTRSTTGV